MRSHGCPRCSHYISKRECIFLDYLNIPNTKENRQKYIKPYKVDGFNKNKIYEFLGDYYHGNPEKYKSNEYNQTCHKTFGELYEKTTEKFSKLNELGYSIYYVWENDWNSWHKNKRHSFPLKKYNKHKNKI